MRLTLTALLVLMLVPGVKGEPPQVAPDTARAVDKGIEWLLKAQRRDGSWGLDIGTRPEMSCTVVAALALVAGGNTVRGGPDPRCVAAVRSAVEYILRQGRGMRDDIWRGQPTLVQNKLGKRIHSFFASVLLSQVYGMNGPWVTPEDREELRELISTLGDRIVSSQEADGSWHKNTFGSLKATCMAWLALRAAHSTGLNVEGAAVDKTVAFIKNQYNPSTKMFDRTAGTGNYQSIYATASCLRVLYGMGEGHSQEAVGATDAFIVFVKTGRMGAAYLTVEGEDYMSAALVSHALLMENDKRWRTWFPWITEQMLKRQNPDGSWVTTACINGRTFPTAFALMTLQTPNQLRTGCP